MEFGELPSGIKFYLKFMTTLVLYEIECCFFFLYFYLFNQILYYKMVICCIQIELPFKIDFSKTIVTFLSNRVSKIFFEYPIVQLHKNELATPFLTIGHVHSSNIKVMDFPFFVNFSVV